MAPWIERVTLTDEDLIGKINRAGSPTKTRMPGVEIPVGDVVAPCRVQFSRPLTDAEREQLKEAIIALAGRVEDGLIVDLQLGRMEEPVKTGFKVPGPVKGHVSNVYFVCHAKLEPADTPVEEP